MEDERDGLPSASNWHRYELCFGSFQLALEAHQLGQEAYRHSYDAFSGERRHAVMAGEPGVGLSESEATSVEFMRERADDQVKRLFGEKPFTELKEHRFWLVVDGKRVASGRADRVVVAGATALIQDYKFGFREPVPAEINAQLKFLSVVVAIQLPHITEVVGQIISGPYGVTETRFSVAQLAHAYNEVLETLRAINDPYAAFSPSVEACRYCPAALICQATKDLVLPVARQQCSALPDGDRAAKLLDECELLERHINAIRAWYSEQMLEDPAYAIPGWSMQPGPQKRQVTDWRVAKTRLAEFLDPAELEELANFSIPEVQKLVARTLQLKAREAGVKLTEILGDCLSFSEARLSLQRVKSQSKTAQLVQG